MNIKSFQQLKAIASPNCDLNPSNGPSPLDLICSMEEFEEQAEQAVLELTPTMQAALIRRSAMMSVAARLGTVVTTKEGRKLGILPKGADRIVTQAQTGIDIESDGTHRGWDTTPEELVSSTVWALQRIQDLEAWKVEQSVIRRAQRHFMKEETRKQDVAGKKQWVEAQTFELPPLVRSEGTSLTHEDARYAIRLPDGTYVDLGITQGAWKPVMRSGPDAAMQSIAKRLGKELRGGAHTILQALTGMDDIIPAYQTHWYRNQWFVIVGWQKDPKLTPSSYWLDEAGQLTQLPNAELPALTLSELDYHLLKESADLGIEDESGTIVDYEDPAEACYNLGVERDGVDGSIDFSKFADDDDETELLMFLQGAVDRSESSLTLGDVGCAQANELLEGELCDDGKGGTKWVGGLYGAKHNLKTFTFLFHQEPTQELARSVEFWTRQVVRFERMIATRDMLLESHEKPAERRNPMTTMSHEFFMKETPRVIPGASLAGLNEVERPIVADALFKPAHRTTTLQRVKRGTTAAVVTADGWTTKVIPHLPKAPVNARNASPALTAKLRGMIASELDTGSTYKAVADAFLDALEFALRAD